MNLILVGYMGSGKSSVGKRLANRMGFRFIDLDTHIEEYAKASVKDIFDENGEEVFRGLETHVLSNVIHEKSIVLATGGGTPCHSGNMELLLEKGFVVYLELKPEKLKKRLLQAKSQRPLIMGLDEDELMDFISSHLEKRLEFYEKAHLVVDGDKINAKALDEIRDRVLDES